MKREIISSVITAALLMLTGSAFAGSATISWDANNDDDLSGYRIYYGTDKGGPYGSSTSLIPKAQTSYTVPDLNSGTYYFVVTAVDNSGNESAYSSEVSKTITSASTSADTTTNTSNEAPADTSSTEASTGTAASTSTTETSTSSANETGTAPTGTASSPIPLPATGAYGKVSGDANQLQEVNFSFSGRAGKVKISYQGYDVDSKKEVSILINGRRVGYAKKTKNDKWGKTRAITIKAKYVKNSGNNLLTFRNSNSANKWGIRNLRIK